METGPDLVIFKGATLQSDAQKLGQITPIGCSMTSDTWLYDLHPGRQLIGELLSKMGRIIN